MRHTIPVGVSVGVGVVALSAALAGCHSSAREDETDSDDDDTAQEVPEVEAALDVNVDAIAVRHGELRIAGSFADGSPDVSMWTASESCEKREVGHGIATRTGFMWSLGGDDLERALHCNLLVRVRVTEDGVRYRKEKQLDVSMIPVPDAEDVVKLVKNEVERDATRLGFRTTERASRLRVGASLIGAEPEDDEAERVIEGPFDSEYLVADEDLSRAILSRRPMSILGVAIQTIVTVGGVALDLADDLPPVPTEPMEVPDEPSEPS